MLKSTPMKAFLEKIGLGVGLLFLVPVCGIMIAASPLLNLVSGGMSSQEEKQLLEKSELEGDAENYLS